MATKIEQLRAWLIALHAEPVAVDHDTDLIESGLITSLQFVQMVIEIERISDSKIEPGVITVENMRTLQAIEEAVFRPREASAR